MSMYPIRSVFLFVALILIPLQSLGWNPKEDCPEIPEDPVQAQIVAGNLFSEAEADYQASQPLKALKGFLCSHRIMPHENTLFNIVQISKLADHQATSVEILKDFISNVEAKHKTAPIEEIIAELEGREVEGEATGTEETKTTETEAQPPQPESTDGDSSDVAGGASEDAEQNPHSKEWMKVTGLSLVGVGAVALVAGSVFQLMAGKSQQKAEDTLSFNTFEDEEKRMQRFQTLAVVGFVSGGVLVGSGMVLWMLGRKSERLQSARMMLVPSFQGVVLTGRF
jgi:hypothetical protein